MVAPHRKQNPTVHSGPKRPGEHGGLLVNPQNNHPNCSQPSLCYRTMTPTTIAPKSVCELLTYDLCTTNDDFHPDCPKVNLCTANMLRLYLRLQLPAPTRPKLSTMSSLETFSTLWTDNLNTHPRFAKPRPFAPHWTPR